ncbi:hypothetical protein FSY45_20130 [Comamonas sp. Z1]|uniref:hypothetical protein n=1 Tax=Comamonas sp. Z1 TaxID=2601246 RepID=UPI0011E7DF8F|nr:hypothetical protein [Comamonas sp. Z1]TYK74148.1 hypothetical protein FSY45_20130 [Comamonas sp. Z1]
MKNVLYAITGVLFAVSAGASPADSVPIVCEKVAEPSFGGYTLYKKQPKTAEEHAMNIVTGNGVAALLIDKPRRITYVLKEAVNRIENTDGTTQFGGANIEINSLHVKAVSPSQVLEINRTTGEMIHTFILSDEAIALWKDKHGGTPPKYGTWRYLCKKSTPAF